MRRLLLFVSVIALLLIAQLSTAKGPPEQVTITGPGLDEPLVLDDPELMQWFDLAVLSDLNHDRFEKPENLGEPYQIDLQFTDDLGTIQTFYSTSYYRDPQELRGYTHDQNGWRHTTPAGEAALMRVIDGIDIWPYIVAMNDTGLIQFHDVSLETAYSLQVDLLAGMSLQTVQGSYDGRQLYLTASNGSSSQSFVINLTEGSICPADSFIAFEPEDQDSDQAVLDELNAESQTGPYQLIDVTPYYIYALDPVGGIWALGRMGGQDVHWYQGIGFSQAIWPDYRTIFATNTLEKSGETSLYRLENFSQGESQRVTLGTGEWHIAYTTLDLSHLDSTENVSQINVCASVG